MSRRGSQPLLERKKIVVAQSSGTKTPSFQTLKIREESEKLQVIARERVTRGGYFKNPPMLDSQMNRYEPTTMETSMASSTVHGDTGSLPKVQKVMNRTTGNYASES